MTCCTRFLVCLLLGVVFLPVNAARACNCAMLEDSVEPYVKRAAAVFSGEVVAIRPHATWRNSVLFRVKDAWKGIGSREVIVWTYNNQGACGYPFAEGESYLVFASPHPRDRKRLEVGLCGRTQRIDQAKEDLSALGPHRPLEKPNPAPVKKPPSKKPLKLPAVQRRLAGRWERSDGKGRVYIEPTGPSSGTLFIWRDRWSYAILPYTLQKGGAQLIFPADHDGRWLAGFGDVSHIEVQQMDGQEMSWRLVPTVSAMMSSPPTPSKIWRLKRGKPLPASLMAEEDA